MTQHIFASWSCWTHRSYELLTLTVQQKQDMVDFVQAFAQECQDQKNGGRVKGMPEKIRSKSMLVEILTSIIFVCGPGHGAINFSQYDYMSFIPNMPLSIYQDYQLLADQTEPITEGQLMSVRNPPPSHLKCRFVV